MSSFTTSAMSHSRNEEANFFVLQRDLKGMLDALAL